MANINITATFSPATPGAVTVQVATGSQIVPAIIAALDAQRSAPAAQVVAIDTAKSNVNS